MCILKLFAGLRAVSGIGLVSSLTLLSVTLVSVFLFSCDDPTGSGPEVIAVHGTVSSLLSGRPLSGATVTLTRHGAPVETAQTSVDGAYSFTGIEARAGYTVSVDAVTGYLATETDTFTVSGVTTVPIMLDRAWPSEGTVVATAVPLSDIAFAPDGAIYCTNAGANKILKIAPGSDSAEDYAGTGIAGVVDGSLASATFNQPYGIAVSADGTGVYATDVDGHRVRYITGGQVSTIAGSGSGGFSGDNGDAKQAELNCPIGVAVDAAGNVYIADSLNQVVRKISAADGK